MVIVEAKPKYGDEGGYKGLWVTPLWRRDLNGLALIHINYWNVLKCTFVNFSFENIHVE